MSSLNKAMIIGRLGQDPEVRFTQNNTAVATLSVATSERYKDKQTGEMKETTEWHRVVAWGRLAEIIQQYGHKGQQVYVEGKIQTRKWQDKDGQDRYTTEINAFTFTMLSKAEGGNGQQGGNQSSQPRANSPVSSGTNLDENFDDLEDDLPF